MPPADAVSNPTPTAESYPEPLLETIRRERQLELTRQAEKLDQEIEREQLVFEGMKSKGAQPFEMKMQRDVIRMLQERKYRKLRTDGTLSVPEEVYGLLDLEGVDKGQRLWLMWYCFTNGSPMEACSKACVKYRLLQQWMSPETPNAAFRLARQDVDSAFIDLAEQSLKSMVTERNPASVNFFLKARHPDYQVEAPKSRELKAKVKQADSDYSKLTPAQKSTEFLASLGTPVKVEVATK
jgi:hypothetical protein